MSQPVDRQTAIEFELVRSPFPEQPVRVELEPLQLECEEEFALFRELAHESDVPILVSPRELYQLLETVLVRVLAIIPQTRLTVMNVNVPGGLRLPERLMADDVFLVQNVSSAYDECISRGIACLEIVQDVRRFPIEYGRNRLRLRFPSPTEEANVSQRLIEALGPLGLARVPPGVALS